MIAILALSDFRGPSFMILVYPPCLSIYFGAISLNNFLTVAPDNSFAKILLLAILLSFARVMNFSATDRNSLALASVVFIFPCKKRLVAMVLKRAIRWFFGLDNILPLFRFRIASLNAMLIY